MTEYTLLCNKTREEIEKDVNVMIRRGWQVQGGISCQHLAEGFYLLYQAMIKEIPETKTEPAKDY